MNKTQIHLISMHDVVFNIVHCEYLDQVVLFTLVKERRQIWRIKNCLFLPRQKLSLRNVPQIISLSTWLVMVPSPSISNSLKASLNSSTCCSLYSMSPILRHPMLTGSLEWDQVLALERSVTFCTLFGVYNTEGQTTRQLSLRPLLFWLSCMAIA